MPVTVATQIAVCSVPIEDGVATTVTAVTVGCITEVETATTADPNFVTFCVEVALIVSAPEVGTVDGAVYRPVLVIVPETADHVTAEL